MSIKQLGALFSFFLLFSNLNADAAFKFTVGVGCQVTYEKNPVCSAQGDMTYGMLGIHRNPATGRRTQADSYGVMGLGSSFNSAWEDAHRVCELKGCHITSCDYEEDLRGFSLGAICQCSYSAGNTCGRRIGATGSILEGSISSLVEQAEEICRKKLQRSNAPAQAVSFAHDCVFSGIAPTTFIDTGSLCNNDFKERGGICQ